jgi:hypothetical protein
MPFLSMEWHSAAERDRPVSEGNKLLLVNQRAFTGDHFKIFMETCKIVEATFVTKAFDALIVFN